MTGFACHATDEARIFVLTESNKAIAKGYNFVTKFNDLIRFLRKRYGKFEYCCILHLQGKKERLNYHVLYFGSYIDQNVIEEWWMKNYASHRSKMELVHNPKWAANYLAGYMGKEEKFIRANFSSHWVFPGWWLFSKWWKKQNGKYLPDSLKVIYSHLSTEQLENDAVYSLFRTETRKSVGNERIRKCLRRNKVPLYDKVLGSDEYKIESIEVK